MEDSEATINAIVDIGICGNDIIEDDEDCEGSNLGNHTCADFGFSGGTLSCDISCSFDTSMCFGAPIRSIGPMGLPVNPDDVVSPADPIDLLFFRSFDTSPRTSAADSPMSRLAPVMSRYGASNQGASLITSTAVQLFSPINRNETRPDRCSCAIVVFF